MYVDHLGGQRVFSSTTPPAELRQDGKRQRSPAACHPDHRTLTRESLPPASTPRAERCSQHERLLPHGSFRPPQPAGNLPRRNFLGQRFKLADITLGPLAPL